MWTPTHVQVTVQRAQGLICKGKNGTNDCFVTIGLGKEKFETSVKERATDQVEWHEECELTIPKQGNKAEIVLTVLNRNFIGDDFLGIVQIPLSEFDSYKESSPKWYPLRNKTGRDNTKPRGQLQVKIVFTAKPGAVNVGSLSDLSKKESHKSSFGRLVGGSLLSLGKEKKGLKNLAKAVGHKVSTLPGRGKKKPKDDNFGTIPEQGIYNRTKQNKLDADPGVISDDEDEFRFDELSHKSSQSSLSVSHSHIATPKDGSLENLGGGEFLRKSYATPPRGKQTFVTIPGSTLEDHNLTKGNNPMDEWETKLFGRQHALANSPKFSEPVRQSQTYNRDNEVKVEPEPPQPIVEVNRYSKPEPIKEPIPKPRPIQEIIKTDSNSKIKGSTEDLSGGDDEKVKPKEKQKASAKDSFVSMFTSSKTKDTDDHQGGKGTPIGITSPMRQKESESRFPREIVKKFEGKSRDDLIEMVLNLQSSCDQQKQRIGDMEEYLENLLVRVMESKPTLLQSPYVSFSSIKSNKYMGY